MHKTPSLTRTLLLTSATLALAACGDSPVAPSSAPSVRQTATTTGLHADRLATIEFQGRFPALYIQNADGSGRFRVHFENVRDRIAGNYPADMLPVRDENILALGPAKWSPDGQQLAVVVSVAYDQSEIVVMNANGLNMRTVSPNSQWITGDVDWAPDSRAIAYTMSTDFYGRRADLFATDLVKDEVQRLTVGQSFSAFTEYRWDAAGRRLWFTQFEGMTQDDMNRVSRLAYADVGTGAAPVVTDRILVGDAQGIARDGSWALVMRYPKGSRDWSTREFVRVSLAGDGAQTVLSTGDLLYAELMEGDREAILVVNDASDPYAGRHRYHVAGLGAPDDVRTKLDVDPFASSIALLRGGNSR
jgi:hypothetical protein